MERAGTVWRVRHERRQLDQPSGCRLTTGEPLSENALDRYDPEAFGSGSRRKLTERTLGLIAP
jgi:hypothetical protein